MKALSLQRGRLKRFNNVNIYGFITPLQFQIYTNETVIYTMIFRREVKTDLYRVDEMVQNSNGNIGRTVRQPVKPIRTLFE